MGWGENDRGVSFTFGPEIVSKYLAKHDMDLICRAHQVSGEGGGGGQYWKGQYEGVLDSFLIGWGNS